jgi:acyl-CoA oxidase
LPLDNVAAGFGNNAVEMETTAIYDKASNEFIVNTPTTLAQKYWITNGAVHAKHIVVFAKLIVDGKNEGIHGVLVRIRDNNLKVTAGLGPILLSFFPDLAPHEWGCSVRPGFD